MPTIWVSKGEKEYVGATVTEANGEDISAIVFGVGLSTSSTEPPAAASFATPDVSVQGATTASRTLKKLIDDTVSVGDYYLWAKLPDTPEVPYVLLVSEAIRVK